LDFSGAFALLIGVFRAIYMGVLLGGNFVLRKGNKNLLAYLPYEYFRNIRL
jgi:purine-cytosine permease-like protein